MSEHQ